MGKNMRTVNCVLLGLALVVNLLAIIRHVLERRGVW